MNKDNGLSMCEKLQKDNRRQHVQGLLGKGHSETKKKAEAESFAKLYQLPVSPDQLQLLKEHVRTFTTGNRFRKNEILREAFDFAIEKMTIQESADILILLDPYIQQNEGEARRMLKACQMQLLDDRETCFKLACRAIAGVPVRHILDIAKEFIRDAQRHYGVSDALILFIASLGSEYLTHDLDFVLSCFTKVFKKSPKADLWMDTQVRVCLRSLLMKAKKEALKPLLEAYFDWSNKLMRAKEDFVFQWGLSCLHRLVQLFANELFDQSTFMLPLGIISHRAEMKHQIQAAEQGKLFLLFFSNCDEKHLENASVSGCANSIISFCLRHPFSVKVALDIISVVVERSVSSARTKPMAQIVQNRELMKDVANVASSHKEEVKRIRKCINEGFIQVHNQLVEHERRTRQLNTCFQGLTSFLRELQEGQLVERQ